jgi:ABC-type Na+ transport system ATPase subunit NatA
MLEARAVSFSYNGKTVLDSVSIEIRRGDFLGVIGPNGAGKSTLLRILARILVPAKGGVYFDGGSLGELPAREIARRIAVLPAETFHPYDFKVMEIVKMGRAPHMSFWSEGGEKDMNVVREALEAVEIGHLAERNIHSLSSGERQMVYLAQAMAQEHRAFGHPPSGAAVQASAGVEPLPEPHGRDDLARAGHGRAVLRAHGALGPRAHGDAGPGRRRSYDGKHSAGVRNRSAGRGPSRDGAAHDPV